MKTKEIDLLELAKIIWFQRKFIIATILIFVILAAGLSLLLPKIYKATAVIMPQQARDSRVGAFLGDFSAFGLGNMLGGSEKQFRLLVVSKSRKLLEKMNKKFNFQKRYNTENLEFTYNALREHINVKVGEQNQIYVSVYDKDQDAVAIMANYFVECLDSLNIILSNNNARFNREFIQERVNIVNDSLLFFENKMTDFMKKHGIITIPKQLESGVTHAANLQANITAKEIELSLKKSYSSENNPMIKAIEKELSLLRIKYNNFFTDKENRLFINFNSVPNLQIEYIQLERKMIYYTKLLEYLGPQYEQAKIEEAKDIPTIQILDKAVRPERRDKPKRKLIVIVFGFIGFMFSVIYLSLYSSIKQVDLSQKKIF